MPSSERSYDGSLFIVDNSDPKRKAQRYLREWCDIARAIDIATGYFEIGALLALDDEWQKLDEIRLLMGDEVSRRTKQAFEQGLRDITAKLDESLETAKDDDDFLTGVPAIVEAIQNGKIQSRVYRKEKFHAKAYITHARMDVVGSMALVGSSNFTYPGLNDNVELNIQIRHDVEQLQNWYEYHWNEAEDVTTDILQTIDRHVRDYLPFEVYAKALAEYFKGHELSVSEWERGQSQVYPILDHYQREGYHALMKIASRYNGALLCDGVGLGKTFVGLMLIERLLFDRKRVVLLVPKAAREPVWEAKINRYLPDAFGMWGGLRIFNHTDLLRGGEYEKHMENIQREADVFIIDEAHHFRNRTSQRYRRLFELAEDKQIFLLTATPINNSTYDLMHMIDLFSRRQPDYFAAAPLGIKTILGHFRDMEHALMELVGNGNGQYADTAARAEEILSHDELFRALVVQRSREYAKRSQMQNGSEQEVIFPDRQDPVVASYSLAKTYGSLLDKIERAFDSEKPLLRLSIYYPLAFYRGDREGIDPFEEGRQSQVVGLIRTLLLKRFESSTKAFEATCEYLLLKLLQFVRLHNERTAKRWEEQHEDLLGRIVVHLRARGMLGDVEEQDEDVIPEEFKQQIDKLDEKEFDVTPMVFDALLDLDQLAEILEELADFDPANDDKIQVLIDLLQTDDVLSRHKVLIFSEFQDTAKYVYDQLLAAGIEGIDKVDSSDKRDRNAVIRKFAPYYNDSCSAELEEQGVEETRILISTDVLSEGLNLQDATCIINYDLHWNPVRLMQRIGRVDRRLDLAVEDRMLTDHPEMSEIRGTVWLWNFLPPDELNRVLSLYERVTNKTLRISKTFGIEGRKLLTPDDEYESLKEFNQAYEGTATPDEEMHLIYQQLLKDDPDLEERLEDMPLRVFSGKANVEAGAQGAFFCYRLPGKTAEGEWTDAAGFTKWYYYDFADGAIYDNAPEIHRVIECAADTPRQAILDQQVLRDARKALDKHIRNSYMKSVQAPVGVKPVLIAWMELA